MDLHHPVMVRLRAHGGSHAVRPRRQRPAALQCRVANGVATYVPGRPPDATDRHTNGKHVPSVSLGKSVDAPDPRVGRPRPVTSGIPGACSTQRASLFLCAASLVTGWQTPGRAHLESGEAVVHSPRCCAGDRGRHRRCHLRAQRLHRSGRLAIAPRPRGGLAAARLAPGASPHRR